MGPISLLIIVVLCIIFATKLNSLDTRYESFNYLWRSLRHADMMHIAANLIAFFYLSKLETQLGSMMFGLVVASIWIVSSLMLYAYHKLLPSRQRYTVGFSAVVFGLLVIFYLIDGRSGRSVLTSMIFVIAPQIAFPGISYEGHACGVLAGFLTWFLFRGLIQKNLLN